MYLSVTIYLHGYFRLVRQNQIMSWYHSSLLTTDRRPSHLIASCKRFSRRLSTGIFRAVRRIQVPGISMSVSIHLCKKRKNNNDKIK
jgi:hypothetical protein